MKKITMQDIADQLNISKNTVSQAFTGKNGISEKTRKLVMNKADELGYNYRKGKDLGVENSHQKQTFALIASEFAFSQSSFFGQIYLSVEKELQNRGIQLVIQSITPAACESLNLPHFAENKLVDGIIILSHISRSYIEKVIQTGIPTILIDHHDPTLEVDSILTNNRFGAYQAVKHLIDYGHEKIAFMGDVNLSPSYQERWEGYLMALRENNYPIREEWMFTDIMEAEKDVWESISTMKEFPTAWFCVNDGLGFFTHSSLMRKGFQIPKDVSICNFDNGKLSNIVSPKITTMDIDLAYYGKKAVDQLIWRLNNPSNVHQEILIPAKLLVKGSTGTC